MIKKKCCGVLRIAVGMIILGLLLAGSANAATITVNASGGGDYSRIQDAIKASSNGDTILVQSGTYFENVKVNKKLTLRGIGMPVVDARGSGSAISLSANGITLEGFTATGGGSYPNAGIKVTSSNNTLIGNDVRSNHGNGIFLSYSNNNKLRGNNASNNRKDYEDTIEAGIYLYSSSKNTLNGNTVSKNAGDEGGYGIYLESSSKNTLNGNNASNNYEGISLESSSNNTLTSNNANSNHGNGIFLSYSSNNTLNGNTASNNGDDGDSYGIYLYYSSNNTMTGNKASNNWKGISLSSSNKNTFKGNIASNNVYSGIILLSSSNNTLSGNMMTGNQENFNLDGYTDSDFDNHIDKSNLVDERPIYYIIKYSDTTYDSSTNPGTFYCISCVNVTIKNLNLNKNGKGVFFWNTSQSRIQNVSASNNGAGISLSSSSKNTLNGNTASKNEYDGILLSSSSKNTLSGNMMTGNQRNFNLYGDTDSDFYNHIDTSNLVDGKPIYYKIKTSDTTYDSSSIAGTFYCISCVNVTIKNLNLKGIYFWNTSQSRIQNVNASNNEAGIYLKSSSNNTLNRNNASNNNNEGISLWDSSNNILTGNNVSNNHDGGISLWHSSNNILTGNNVSNNHDGGGDYNSGGIYLSFSNNNKIYNNIFNNTNNVKFWWSMPKNKWNTTRQSGTNIIGGPYIGGNFWANPDGTGFSQTCPDVNGDGICEKSYILDAKNIDYLPLAIDKISPKSVSNLKNVSYASSYINWTWKDPKDIDFKKVMVFIDGKLKKNVSKGKRFYNATNFTANTRHTISTWTVDWNGNINKTWKNSSVWTAK
ncbi:MAG: right-handed parallel beta-helix repeat-containing protein [Candidatus Methanoperedens sp.]|nr:right-handed parallel beta-helix repeat-containing protein [Candidatus Methanoperedens sp.]